MRRQPSSLSPRHRPCPDCAHEGATASLCLTTQPLSARLPFAVLALLPNPNRIRSTAKIPALGRATNPTTITPILPRQRRSAGCFTYPYGRIYGRGACDMDALVDALGAVRALANHAPSLPAVVERTIAEAKAVSEAESGEGVAETLRRITGNTGRIEGGIGVNTIPDRARALCDIRIPPGVTVDRVRAALAAAIDPLPDVSWRILACMEPSWTDPKEAIVRAVRENPAAVHGGMWW